MTDIKMDAPYLWPGQCIFQPDPTTDYFSHVVNTYFATLTIRFNPGVDKHMGWPAGRTTVHTYEYKNRPAGHKTVGFALKTELA